MGCGMPEYLLLFRKPPTDRSNGYADVPVVKSKDSYSLGRWQLDAHGFQRSNGNRLLAPEDLDGLSHEMIYKLFKRFSLTSYDYERTSKLQEALEQKRKLPVTFMLLPPHSWHPDVWTDVARMRTLNTMQEAKGREMHLCPLQFDIVDRLIVAAVDGGRDGLRSVRRPLHGPLSCARARPPPAIGIELTLFDLIEESDAAAIGADPTTPTR
jgi:hypothetical protein